MSRAHHWLHWQLCLVLALGAIGLACSETVSQEPAPARQPVETKASVDRAVATTGDLITYRVTIDYDSELEIELPEPGAEIAGFRIVDLGRQDSELEPGRKRHERWYELRADLVGSYVLPPVRVTYRPLAEVLTEGPEEEPSRQQPSESGAGQGTQSGVAETSEIFVEVESVLPEGGEAADIRGLKPLAPAPQRFPWGWAAASGALLVALGAWLWWRRRTVGDSVKRTLPAHEVAFARLATLRQFDFADPAELRRFYFQISETLREYIEGRFGLNATDLTSEEIAERLNTLRVGASEQEQLRRFLQSTDSVKFAHQDPSEKETEWVYETALSFVERTQQRPDEMEAAVPQQGPTAPAVAPAALAPVASAAPSSEIPEEPEEAGSGTTPDDPEEQHADDPVTSLSSEERA